MYTVKHPYTQQKSTIGGYYLPAFNYHDEDMQLAESIVKRLMLRDLHINDLNLAIRYEMAAHIGGDLAYVYPVDSTHTYMTICDVVGHGVASCLLVAYIHTQVLMILQNKPDNLFEFIHQLNEVCYHDFHELTLYFTYAVVRYDHSDSTFQIITCGHPPIMVLKSGELPAYYSTSYPPLGLFPYLNAGLEEKKYHLEQGDRIVLYTDGILEAENGSSKDFFGEKRLVDMLLRHQNLSDSDLAELIVKEVKNFSGQEIHDDLTLMIMSQRE